MKLEENRVKLAKERKGKLDEFLLRFSWLRLLIFPSLVSSHLSFNLGFWRLQKTHLKGLPGMVFIDGYMEYLSSKERVL